MISEAPCSSSVVWCLHLCSGVNEGEGRACVNDVIFPKQPTVPFPVETQLLEENNQNDQRLGWQTPQLLSSRVQK